MTLEEVEQLAAQATQDETSPQPAAKQQDAIQQDAMVKALEQLGMNASVAAHKAAVSFQNLGHQIIQTQRQMEYLKQLRLMQVQPRLDVEVFDPEPPLFP